MLECLCTLLKPPNHFLLGSQWLCIQNYVYPYWITRSIFLTRLCGFFESTVSFSKTLFVCRYVFVGAYFCLYVLLCTCMAHILSAYYFIQRQPFSTPGYDLCTHGCHSIYIDSTFFQFSTLTKILFLDFPFLHLCLYLRSSTHLSVLRQETFWLFVRFISSYVLQLPNYFFLFLSYSPLLGF